ncbi:MAG: hypothetical protein ACRC10_05885 [Thermoguttaceae bacterium]
MKTWKKGDWKILGKTNFYLFQLYYDYSSSKGRHTVHNQGEVNSLTGKDALGSSSSRFPKVAEID